MGKSRAAVTNLLRLTDLEDDVQALLRAGQLSFGHAKVLLGCNGAKQSQLAKQVVEKQLSVRQTEALVHAEPRTGGKKAAPAAELPQAERIASKWGVRVEVQQTPSGKGTLKLGFANAAALEKLLAALS